MCPCGTGARQLQRATLLPPSAVWLIYEPAERWRNEAFTSFSLICEFVKISALSLRAARSAESICDFSAGTVIVLLLSDLMRDSVLYSLSADSNVYEALISL